MKHLLKTCLFAVGLMVLTAGAFLSSASVVEANMPTLIRGHVFQADGTSIHRVKNVLTGHVVTEAELASANIDIFDTQAVYAYMNVKFDSDVYQGGGFSYYEPGPDGVLNTSDDIPVDRRGDGNNW